MLRTANYSASARTRLGEAVSIARQAAGFPFRPQFAKRHGINKRSLELLEHGDPGVGETILFAVARALPNWTESTPRAILEGGPIPPTASDNSVPAKSAPRAHEWSAAFRKRVLDTSDEAHLTEGRRIRMEEGRLAQLRYLEAVFQIKAEAAEAAVAIENDHSEP